MSCSPRREAPKEDDEYQDEIVNQGRQRRRAKQKKRRHASIHDDDSSSSSSHDDDSSENPFEETRHEGQNEDNDDENNNDTAEVSLNDLKHSILGRSVRTQEDDQDNNHDNANATTEAGEPLSTAELRRTLLCAICHELLWQPVAVPCGHAFCYGCLEWWWHHAAAAAVSCPTCRRALPVVVDDDDDDEHDSNDKTSSVGLFRQTYHVSAVLRACLQTNFPVAYQNRAAAAAAAQRRATAGEDGGAHSAGYKVLQDATTSSAWKSIATTTATLQWRRSVVRDAMDQRMQLALALYQTSSNNVESVVDWTSKGGILHLTLCLLSMEEDEVEDSGGFPAVVQANSDAAHLIVTDTRFAAVPVEVCVEVTPSRSVPVTRRALHDDGTVTFTIDTNQDVFGGEEDDSNSQFQGRPLTFVFCHAETQAEFHLRVPPMDDTTFSQNDEARLREIQPIQKKRKTYLAYQDDQSEENDDDDDDAQDEFEHDGFVVHGDDDDEHNNDICAVCRDGGDMMVCDGGDVTAGCGKSFHIQCVQRDEIPEGDWICEACARDHGLGEIGIKGHEFPPDDTQQDGHDNNDEEDAPPEGNANIASSDEEDAGAAAFSDADQDSDGDDPAPKRAAAFSDSEEESRVKVSKPATKRQRIMDSDEDDE